MRAEALAALACPVCASLLSEVPGALRCELGHSFDIARQGYVNLLASPAPSAGDTAEMVAARHAFLESGHFAPVAKAAAHATAEAICEHQEPRVIAEVGAGTGYYLAAAVDAAGAQAAGVALDVSKYAARRAAKSHPAILAVVANAWDRLPLADAATAVLLDIFAPRNASEFARVLEPGGRLIVVTPNAGHLAGLAAAVGLLAVEADKDARVAEALSAYFERDNDATVRVAAHLELTRDDALAVAGMGPSAHHIAPDELAVRIAALPEVVPAELDVTVGVWRRRA